MNADVQAPRFRWLRAVLAFVVTGAIALPVLFELALAVVPTLTPDGHRVMPIGQAGFALIAAPLLAGVAAYLAGRP